jgi:hypothetical protein
MIYSSKIELPYFENQTIPLFAHFLEEWFEEVMFVFVFRSPYIKWFVAVVRKSNYVISAMFFHCKLQ